MNNDRCRYRLTLLRQQVINYPHVKEMFNIAHRILGYDLHSKCLNGPIDELNQTLYAQPAIYITSLAAVQKLKSENEKVRQNVNTIRLNNNNNNIRLFTRQSKIALSQLASVLEK
jgi:hypothetical protein